MDIFEPAPLGGLLHGCHCWAELGLGVFQTTGVAAATLCGLLFFIGHMVHKYFINCISVGKVTLEIYATCNKHTHLTKSGSLRQEMIRKSVILFKCEQNRNNCGIFLLWTVRLKHTQTRTYTHAHTNTQTSSNSRRALVWIKENPLWQRDFRRFCDMRGHKTCLVTIKAR